MRITESKRHARAKVYVDQNDYPQDIAQALSGVGSFFRRQFPQRAEVWSNCGPDAWEINNVASLTEDAGHLGQDIEVCTQASPTEFEWALVYHGLACVERNDVDGLLRVDQLLHRLDECLDRPRLVVKQ